LLATDLLTAATFGRVAFLGAAFLGGGVPGGVGFDMLADCSGNFFGYDQTITNF
jgi:hypothetical protein